MHLADVDVVGFESVQAGTNLSAEAGAGEIVRLRDWRILIAPLAAGLIGFGLYPLLETVWTAENETPAYIMVWLAQSAAILVATWLGLRRRGTGLPQPGSHQKSARSPLA